MLTDQELELKLDTVCVTQDMQNTLESIIDNSSLLHVLTALELICFEKASFVNSCESIGNPDPQLAKLWMKCGSAIYKAAIVSERLP